MVTRKALETLIGVIMINFIMGTYFCFGNMMTYIVSYMRKNNYPDLTYSDFFLVNALFAITRGIGTVLAGYVSDLIGTIPCIFCGCFLFSSSVGITYFLIQGTSFWLICLVYGCMRALGMSFTLIPTVKLLSLWFKKNKGFAIGVGLIGHGGAALLFNPLQTYLANPTNIHIDKNTGYLVDDKVIQSVPMLLIYLCLIYSLTTLIGCLLLKRPVPNSSECSDEESGGHLEEETGLILLSSDFEAFRHREFYILWIARFVFGLQVVVIASFFKPYGSTFIQDDQALSFSWTISSLAQVCARPLAGYVLDKWTYKVCMLLLSAFTTLLLVTFCHTSLVGLVIFTIYGSCFLAVAGFYYTAITTACLNVFGQKRGSKVCGFMEFSETFLGLFALFVNGPLLSLVGWCWYFRVYGSFGAVVFVATLLFPAI